MNNKFYFPSIRSNVIHFTCDELIIKSINLKEKVKKFFILNLVEPQISTPDPIIEEIKKLLKLNLPGYTPQMELKN